MKKQMVSRGILAITLIVLTIVSCKDGKKTNSNEDNPDTEMHDNASHDHTVGHDKAHPAGDKKIGASGDVAMSSPIIDNYLELKNALVADNQDKAASSGSALAKALEDFDTGKFDEGKQEELMEIIEVAKEHGEHIAKSDIDHQRVHFEEMGKDMVDLIAIAGTPKTLYQQYCPMYNKNKGGMWLSESKEIKNPLFGSKMMTCGSVQKEIN